MKVPRLSSGILNTRDTELIREHVHTFSYFHWIDPLNVPYHPRIPYQIGDSLHIPYQIGDEDGTIFLEGEITSYSDYKNVIDQLIDLKKWEQIETLVFTYKDICFSFLRPGR